MRIFYLNSNYRGEGTFNRCFRIGREQVKLGHQVTLMTITDDPPQKEVQEDEQDGVKLILLPANSRRRDYRAYLKRPRIASRIVEKQAFDLLHAFTAAEPVVWYPAMAAIKQRPKRRFSLVVDWDDWYSRGGLVELKPAKFLLRKRTEHWEESLPKEADAVTVVSEALRKRCLDLGIPEDRVHKVGNGADPSAYELLNQRECRERCGLPLDAVIVLYMGSYNQAMPIALRAFVETASENEDAIFVCVGDISLTHQHLKPHKSLLKLAKNSSKCLFTGKVHGERIPDYLAAADILLLPMENSVVEKARFPIRLGDYLSSGRGVIASDVGEVGRFLREHECALLAKNQEEFNRRLSDLLANVDRAHRLGLLAKRTAQKHLHWESIAKQMLEVYQNMMEDGKEPQAKKSKKEDKKKKSPGRKQPNPPGDG